MYSWIKSQWKSKTDFSFSFFFFFLLGCQTLPFSASDPLTAFFFVCKFSIRQCRFLFCPILPSFHLLPCRCSVCSWRRWWTSSRSIKKTCRTGCLYCWRSCWKKWVPICLGPYKQKFRRHLMSQGNELLKHSENQINKNNPNSSRFICFCIAYCEILELRRPNSRSWNNSLMCLFYRESFPNDLQFSILMRFTVDQTQTPSLKVRIFWLSVQKEIFVDRHLLVLIIEFRLLVLF